jgi:hypothetical protein
MPGGVSKRLCIKEAVTIVKKNFGMFWASLAILYYCHAYSKAFVRGLRFR